MWLLQIKVLLWKSLRIRKKHWLRTLVEITLPCLLFALLDYAGSLANSVDAESAGKTHAGPTADHIHAVSREDLYRKFGYQKPRLVYTPRTEETERIVGVLAKTLHVDVRAIESARDERAMIETFRSRSANGFGIVFQEIAESHVFKYKIRCTSCFAQLSDVLFQDAESAHAQSGEYFNGFEALQLAMDEAFISGTAGQDFRKYDLKIRPFPRPERPAVSDSPASAMRSFVPLLTVMSFLHMCTSTIKAVVEEKESGVRELTRTMGLKPWMTWTGWVLHNLLACCVSIPFIAHTACSGHGKLLQRTDPFLFSMFLTTYAIAAMFFCFAVSAPFSSPMPAAIAGSTLCCVSYVLPTAISARTPNSVVRTLFMLLPNAALSVGYDAILSLETRGKGLRMSTVFTATGNGADDTFIFTFGFAVLAMIVDCFVYGLVAWYVDSVMPDKRRGAGKRADFSCRSKNDAENHEMAPAAANTTDSRLFEKAPAGYEVGMSVKNLYKRFGDLYAVNGLNLDLYRGQITALLGHNGAGKTTTMSILTGIFSPSSGSVKVNGQHLLGNIEYFRYKLGWCPQHNLHISYLTTLDHLIFFGMLKGMKLRNARSEGLRLLKLLNILEKKDKHTFELSGGIQRKLSLAIALIGGPEILILDEPTSGMDPESRREMWDLLLSFRESRTILITTQFMEEADVLGDRIAIMDHGRVKCYGTSLFLKKAYGTGYNLTVVKEERCDVSNMMAAIKDIVPEAEIRSSLPAQVVINLPDEHADKFPEVFRMLETSGKEFRIRGMGISCTTMEEVFLRADKCTLDNSDQLSSINAPSLNVNRTCVLIITKRVGFMSDQLVLHRLVQQYVPQSSLIRSTETQIVYDLQTEEKNRFGRLSSALDVQKQNLKLDGFEIKNQATGDVYTNTYTATVEEDKQVFNIDATQKLKPQYKNQKNLMKNQFKVLLEKKIMYTCRRWRMTLFFFMLPIGMNILLKTCADLLSSNTSGDRVVNVSLSSYYNGDNGVYFRAGDNSSENLGPTFAAVSKANKATVDEAPPANNIINDLLKLCADDEFDCDRRHFLIAGDFNETKSTILYNNTAIHGPAIAINLYSNALLQKLSGNPESYISTLNEPIRLESESEYGVDNAPQIILSWLATFVPGLLYFVGYFMTFPVTERVNGIKHLQMMTKLSPVLYWTACFVWDYFCYTLVVVFTLTVLYSFDVYRVLSGLRELGVLFAILLVFGWSAIFYVYVYSFFKRTLRSSMFFFLTINFVLGVIVNNTMFVGKYFVEDVNKCDALNYLRYASLMVPYLSFPSCVSGFLQITLENHECRKRDSSDSRTDCKLKSYFVFKSDENKDGILEETLFLFFSSALYVTIILLFDYKIFARAYRLGFNAIFGTGIRDNEHNEDPDIDGERDKVDAAKIRSRDARSPILLVDGLVKKFGFKSTGVRGVSFTVSPGECFGLLGVNGAGKTTTFRILTGDTFPSKGDASLRAEKTYKLSSDFNQYVSMIGYCPQFDALNDRLTGKESLKLMAILRGISPSDAEEHVEKWIKLLGLDEYGDRICGKFSGGNKRKLNTAMALIGDPPIVFLDEPTSGMDPVARRNLWRILGAGRRRGQAIVLTSHSMDECEALCDRLTIMVDGAMKCIGNIQYLKNRYGQGFTVMIKLRDAGNADVAKLKAHVYRRFAPNIDLKDEHKGLLHYHITNPRIPLSQIFGQMNAVKENFKIIEDFTVGDTTLEQVFIAFAERKAVLNTIQ